ncbi:TA system toxin CbtA family protein, partial [Escherichia coli]|uniref:TA system toxin CbtA family protein n=1 Tax=Escherichia coli TaxID=562 RepID=UPI003B5897F6
SQWASGYIVAARQQPILLVCRVLARQSCSTPATHSQLINSIDILRARRATGLMIRDNYRTVNNITLGKHPEAKR